MIILSLLGITFYLGSRSLESSRHGESRKNKNNRRVYSKTLRCSSGDASALSTISKDMMKREQGVTSSIATLRVSCNSSVDEGSACHQSRSGITSTMKKIGAEARTTKIIPISHSTVDDAVPDKLGSGLNEEEDTHDDQFATKGDYVSTNRDDAVELGTRQYISSVDLPLSYVSFNEPVTEQKEEVDENNDKPSSRGGFLAKRVSVRRIWKEGPGDDANSEQVTNKGLYSNMVEWVIAHYSLRDISGSSRMLM